MTTEHAEWDLAEGKMITETTTNIAITIWDGEARVLSPLKNTQCEVSYNIYIFTSRQRLRSELFYSVLELSIINPYVN